MIIRSPSLGFKIVCQNLAISSLLCFFLLRRWLDAAVAYDSFPGSRLQDVVAVVAKLRIFHLHPEVLFVWFSLSLLMLDVPFFHNMDEIQK